ncbi:hypothetical protein Hanom_Chr05g00444301 [Helianthus anomalus]
MAMGICRQGSLSGGELGREIPSAVRGTVQLPFFKCLQKHALSKRTSAHSGQILQNDEVQTA